MIGLCSSGRHSDPVHGNNEGLLDSVRNILDCSLEDLLKGKCGSLVAKVLASHTLGSHMNAGSNPNSHSCHTVPSLWPQKASRTAQSLETMHLCVRTERSFWLQLSSGYCGHLGSESVEGRSSCLSLLLSIYVTFQ